MGGMIAQTMAIEHPERVLSLTSIMSTTGDPDVGQPDARGDAPLLLEPRADRRARRTSSTSVDGGRVIGSPEHFDEDRRAAERAAALRPLLLPGRRRPPAARHPRLAAAAPTACAQLDVADARDPRRRRSARRRSAAASAPPRSIPGAELLVLDGMGHDLPAGATGRRSSRPSPRSPPAPRAGPRLTRARPMAGPARRHQDHRDRGHRPRAVLRDDAGRHGRRRHPGRPRPDRRAAATRPTPPADVLNRGRRSIGVDLKNPDGVETRARRSSSRPTRSSRASGPASTERLGLGPDVVPGPQPEARLRPHDRLGPGRPVRADRRPRHQLHRARRRARADRPRAARRRCRRSTSSATSAAAACCSPSAWCAALLEAQRSGKGQVVDAAMVDGAAVLMTMFHAFRAMGIWEDERGHEPARHRRPLLRRVRDAPTASTCRSARSSRSSTPSCSRLTGLEGDGRCRGSTDKAQWPALKERMRRRSSRPRPATSGARSWRAPTCASRRCCRWPRRRSTRTTSHRETFVERDGVVQPAPAPRFSRTPGEIQRPPSHAGQHTDEVLADWGFDARPTSPSCARPAPSPERGARSLPRMATLVSLPRPSRRRVHRHRRHDGQGGRRRPPGGARGRDRGRARRGRRGVLDDGEALWRAPRASRRTRSAEVLGAAARRVPRLRRLGDDGRARRTTNPASLLAGRRRRGGRAAGRHPARRGRRRRSRSTTTTAATATPTTSRCTGSGCGPPSWPASPRCTRRP